MVSAEYFEYNWAGSYEFGLILEKEICFLTTPLILLNLINTIFHESHQIAQLDYRSITSYHQHLS